MKIHQWPVESPQKVQWRGTLMFSLILAWTNDWTNSRYARDMRRHCANYGVAVLHQHCLYIVYKIYSSECFTFWCCGLLPILGWFVWFTYPHSLRLFINAEGITCLSKCQRSKLRTYPDSKVHGANMGPTWVLSAPDGPHVGPMNLAIWE